MLGVTHFRECLAVMLGDLFWGGVRMVAGSTGFLGDLYTMRPPVRWYPELVI